MVIGPTGRKCARVGCGDTNTKPTKVAGRGGKAYTLWLCLTHRGDLDLSVVPPIPKEGESPHALLVISEVMLGVYRCFGLTFSNQLNLKNKPYDEPISWSTFYHRNRRLRQKGEWFYDTWLTEKAKDCVHIFGYRLKDVSVLIPKKPMPLIIKVTPENPSAKEFTILLAPRIPHDELYYETTGVL